VQFSNNLPNDPEELKKLVIHFNKELITKQNKINQLEHNIIERDRAILRLKGMFQSLKRMNFGSTSEKIDPNVYYQDLFFNEAELGLHDESTLFESHSDEVEVKSHIRKKKGRKPLPDHLERKLEEHDIPEHEKTCECGCRLTEIEPEISEQIVIIPPEVYVRQHRRKKYTCNNCKGDERTEAGKIVVTAPFTTPQIYPGSNLSVETLVYLLLAKWLDSIPFYRIAQMLLRNKIEIPRGTMSNWVIGVYLRYKELLSFFPKLLMLGRLIGVDESWYQVHKEIGRSNTSNSYMWVFRGGLHNKPIIYYHYRTSRSADFLREFLDGYEGFIQADGLPTYKYHLKEMSSLLLAGCMAHVRRKFEDTFRISGEKLAEKILYNISKIYKIEDKIKKFEYYKNGEFEKIVEIRQRESKPLMDHIYIMLQNEGTNLNQSDKLKNAINYALKEWSKVKLFIDHGEIYIDNNLVENAIRPFVLGRKNWLFADVPEGAEASAMYLSIIQTFKVNGLNPQTACMEFFSKLPACKSKDDAENLFISILEWG
jgi:transposase